MSDRHYNDQEAEEILRLASRDGLADGMSKDRLMQTAAELGISPEAVERAEQQILKKREAERIEDEDRALRKQFVQERRNGFMRDLVSYIGVNAGMVGIWWFSGHGYFWPIWVMLAWGIGLATDFAGVFFSQDDAKFQRWKRRRERKSLGAKDIEARTTPILNEIVATGDTITKLDAIKELRERLNVDLRDAKDAVEEYEVKNPGAFA